MISVNNNSFHEGPVLNNLIEDVEDNNNNGDVNGNSEMVDLHSRRLQEEREREQLVLQRNAPSLEEIVTIHEEPNIIIVEASNTLSHDITSRQTNSHTSENDIIDGARALISSNSTTASEDGEEADNSKETSNARINLTHSNDPSESAENLTENKSNEANSTQCVDKDNETKDSDEVKSLDEL